MSSWAQFAEAAPDLAQAVRERFDAHRHKTMATLRADGSPRISGTEVSITGGEMTIGSMPGAVKGADLKRDPRVAIHSGSDEPDEWRGDAKVAGRAVLVTDEAEIARLVEGPQPEPGSFDLFRIDIAEAVVVSLNEAKDRLVIESWHEDRGYERVERE